VKKVHPGPSRDIIARNLRRIRAERDISQEALADLSGLNRSYLGSVERGERNISIDNVDRLAKALKLKPWVLLQPPSGMK
jgi:transcriptional regulator with XRE-family HTH domain